MIRRAALILALAAAAAAAEPGFAIAESAFPYDLRLGGAVLPLCWGPVALRYEGDAAVTITVTFTKDSTHAAGTVDDILTFRSGLQVDVVDAGSAVVDGRAWQWTGPKHGDGAATTADPLRLTSQDRVGAGNALLALRQVCYASQASPRTLVKRRVVFTVRADATTWSDALDITPGTAPMPPVVRFDPLALHRLAGATSAVLAHAGSPAEAFVITRAAETQDVIEDGTGPKPTLLATPPGQAGTAVGVVAPASDGAWQLAVSVSDGSASSLAVIPVAVHDEVASLTIAGALPLELDISATLPDMLDLGLSAQPSTGTVMTDILPHPARGEADEHAAVLAGAFSSTPPRLQLDRSKLRAVLPTPCWLAVGLDLHVGDEVHRVVPWIVHVVGSPDG